MRRRGPLMTCKGKPGGGCTLFVGSSYEAPVPQLLLERADERHQVVLVRVA